MIALVLALFTFGASLAILCIKRGIFEATLATQMLLVSASVGALSAGWSSVGSFKGSANQGISFFLLLLSALQLAVGLAFMHRFRLLKLPATTDVNRSLALDKDREGVDA
jgi:hypothetical protein